MDYYPLVITCDFSFFIHDIFQEIGRKTQFLVRHYDQQVSKGIKPDFEELNLSGSSWMSAADLQRKFGEKISDEMVSLFKLLVLNFCFSMLNSLLHWNISSVFQWFREKKIS